MQICIDSNIALKLVLLEDDSLKVRTLWRSWVQNETELVAPPSLHFEGASVLCTQVHRRLLTADEGRALFQAFRALPVRILYPGDLHERAFEVALHFGQPQAYDAHYLALADMLSCEFWTADDRLYNTVRSQLPWVKWLGNA